MDCNMLLKEIISPLGYPCSEEPIHDTKDKESYIVWRFVSEMTVTASNIVYSKTKKFEIEAVLSINDDADGLEKSLVSAFASRNIRAGVYARDYDAQTRKRTARFYCLLRV